MDKVYAWEYRIDMPPYDKVVAVVEAFFCSYPAGDYACEQREQYKLRFRRGQWKRTLLGLGRWVPQGLAKGRFTEWPIIVHVFARPSPQSYRLVLRYELHVPRTLPELPPEVQSSVDQHIRGELDQLAAYLAECAGAASPPAVVPQ